MNQPLVSVCIGAYNRKRYIRECLDSVLAQTYPNLEIIVVDDASTDGTYEILQAEYAGRARIIRREANSGMCCITRNQAARAARGTYLAFLDSDDAWCPTKIEKQVAFLEAQSAIPLCHTYCYLMDADSKVMGVRHQGNVPPTGNCFRQLLRHCWITISSVMARRSIFDEVGWFTEDARYGIWGEDLEFLLRVARRYKLGLVDESLTLYRRASQNISAGNWKQTPESVPFNLMLLHRRDIWQGVVLRREVVQALVDNCLINATYWGHQGYAWRAAWPALQAVRVAPLEARVWRSLAVEPLRSVWGAWRRREV